MRVAMGASRPGPRFKRSPLIRSDKCLLVFKAAQRLEEHEIKLEVTIEAKDCLAKEGFDKTCLDPHISRGQRSRITVRGGDPPLSPL